MLDPSAHSLQNPARHFQSETTDPASDFMYVEWDMEFEMECFKTIFSSPQQKFFILCILEGGRYILKEGPRVSKAPTLPFQEGK